MLQTSICNGISQPYMLLLYMKLTVTLLMQTGIIIVKCCTFCYN